MPIYQTGPESFMVSVGSGKKRYREVFKTRKEAEIAEAEEILKRKRGAEGSSGSSAALKEEGKGKTLDDAYKLTYRLHWAGQNSAKTQSINSGAVLKALGEDTLLTDITVEEITEMILEFEEAGNSGATVNKKLSCLSMMFKTAKDQGWITKIPPLTRRKESKHRIRWFDVAEEDRMLTMCDTLGLAALRDYIIVGIDTGFRRGELLNFELRDYTNGLLHLHADGTKTEEARAVPATKRVHDIIARRSNYRVLFPELSIPILRHQWDILKDHMGLTEDRQFVVHTLRHTCASRMVQRGVPLSIVQRYMGHKNINTTLRYAHLAPDSLLQAKAALEMEPPVILGAPPVQTSEPALHDF
ncbi:integrase [Ralstonia phage BOESR1]|uniref:Integrase n=1 Tax=Ralstonia phage BOESR1 TaxID=3034917 RepID=A0AA50F2T2_9CAUD|nr:integrase [Ralstonia phage BOESR1]WLW40582.1 integrase [Ralstonia phage BOESR1]